VKGATRNAFSNTPTPSLTTVLPTSLRFALHHRLGRVNIQLAFDMEEQGSTPEALQHSLGFSVVSVPHTRQQRRVWARAILAWIFFTVAGWISIPEGLRFVDESTALTWLAHCGGFTVFLVLVTKQARWLLVNFALGLTLLWILSVVRLATGSIGTGT